MSTRIRCLAVPLVLLAAALLVGACGDDDDQAAETASVSISLEAAGGYSVPDDIEAGLTELTFKNESKQPQDMQLVRIEGERSRGEVVKAFQAAGSGKALPDWFLAAGGVGGMRPGESRSVTQVLQPGSYYAVGTDSKPTFTAFEVRGETSDAELPEEDATVRAFEYGFEAEGVESGNSPFLFENTGAQIHHLIAAPLNDGATASDVQEFLKSPQGGGKPPADLDHSEATAVLEGGTSQVVDLHLKPGRYAFICFISDRQGGPPHALKGMVSEVEVK